MTTKTFITSLSFSEVMKVFAEIVKSHNDNIMNQHRESMKLVESEDIIDLADDFEDAIAS